MKQIALIAVMLLLCAWIQGGRSVPDRLFGSGSTDFLLNDSSTRLLAQ